MSCKTVFLQRFEKFSPRKTITLEKRTRFRNERALKNSAAFTEVVTEYLTRCQEIKLITYLFRQTIRLFTRLKIHAATTDHQATRASNEHTFVSVQNERSRTESYEERLTDFSTLQAPSCQVLLRINCDVTTLRSVPLTMGGNVNKNTTFTQ